MKPPATLDERRLTQMIFLNKMLKLFTKNVYFVYKYYIVYNGAMYGNINRLNTY